LPWSFLLIASVSLALLPRKRRALLKGSQHMERFYLGPFGPGHSYQSPLLYRLSYRLLRIW